MYIVGIPPHTYPPAPPPPPHALCRRLIRGGRQEGRGCHPPVALWRSGPPSVLTPYPSLLMKFCTTGGGYPSKKFSLKTNVFCINYLRSGFTQPPLPLVGFLQRGWPTCLKKLWWIRNLTQSNYSYKRWPWVKVEGGEILKTKAGEVSKILTGSAPHKGKGIGLQVHQITARSLSQVTIQNLVINFVTGAAPGKCSQRDGSQKVDTSVTFGYVTLVKQITATQECDR